MDYVIRYSLAPTVKDLIGVLCVVAVKNHKLVAVKKTFKKFLESIRGSNCDCKCDICERVYILKSSDFRGSDAIKCFYCKFIYWVVEFRDKGFVLNLKVLFAIVDFFLRRFLPSFLFLVKVFYFIGFPKSPYFVHDIDVPFIIDLIKNSALKLSSFINQCLNF